jgi:hypothetical protein
MLSKKLIIVKTETHFSKTEKKNLCIENVSKGSYGGEKKIIKCSHKIDVPA